MFYRYIIFLSHFLYSLPADYLREIKKCRTYQIYSRPVSPTEMILFCFTEKPYLGELHCAAVFKYHFVEFVFSGGVH